MKEKIGFVITAEATVRDKNGNIKSQHIIKENYGLWDAILCKLHLRHHCITKYGMAIVAGLITADVGETAFDFLGIGTGTTVATVDDQDLETSVKKKAATGTRVTTTYTNDTSQLVATFSSADGLSGTSNITEIGEFNAVSGTQKMLLRQVYSPADPCNWDAGDTYTLTVKVQVKQGA